MAGYVFVSYAREDQSYVDSVLKGFDSHGIEYWWDKKLDVGSFWKSVIESMIQSCAALVVIASPAAANSKWVDREIHYAQTFGKEVLPILITGNVPLIIANISYHDAREFMPPGPDYIDKLKTLCHDRRAVPMPAMGKQTPPLPPPGKTPLTWLPYDLGGRPHTFEVRDGVVVSRTIGPDGRAPTEVSWDGLGTGVSGIVATQDGSHLVVRSSAGITVAQVSGRGDPTVLRTLPLADGWRLVAARRPRSEQEPGVGLQILISDLENTRIVPLDRYGYPLATLTLPGAAYAGAGTDDGFLVIGLDSTMVSVAINGQVLARFGDDWLDVDAIPAGGPIAAAGLRRAGAAVMLREADSTADLDGPARQTGSDARAVRLVRKLGTSYADQIACPVTSAGRPLTPFRGLPA